MRRLRVGRTRGRGQHGLCAGPGPRQFDPQWSIRLEGSINLGPTIDRSGRVYVTDNSNDAGCHLHVLDGERLPGTTVFTVGTTIGPDGTVHEALPPGSPPFVQRGVIALAGPLPASLGYGSRKSLATVPSSRIRWRIEARSLHSAA